VQNSFRRWMVCQLLLILFLFIGEPCTHQEASNVLSGKQRGSMRQVKSIEFSHRPSLIPGTGKI
jgi:hypothetical protein